MKIDGSHPQKAFFEKGDKPTQADKAAGPKPPEDLPEQAKGNPGEPPRGNDKAAQNLAQLANSVSQVLGALNQLSSSMPAPGAAAAASGGPRGRGGGGSGGTAFGHSQGGHSSQPATAVDAPASAGAAAGTGSTGSAGGTGATGATGGSVSTGGLGGAGGTGTASGSASTGGTSSSGGGTGTASPAGATSTNSALAALLANRPTFRTTFSGTLAHPVGYSPYQQSSSSAAASRWQQYVGSTEGWNTLQGLGSAPNAYAAREGLESVLGAMGFGLTAEESAAFDAIGKLQQQIYGAGGSTPF